MANVTGRQTWETNEYRWRIASEKGRTAAVTDLGDKGIEMLHSQRKRLQAPSLGDK